MAASGTASPKGEGWASATHVVPRFVLGTYHKLLALLRTSSKKQKEGEEENKPKEICLPLDFSP